MPAKATKKADAACNGENRGDQEREGIDGLYEQLRFRKNIESCEDPAECRGQAVEAVGVWSCLSSSSLWSPLP